MGSVPTMGVERVEEAPGLAGSSEVRAAAFARLVDRQLDAGYRLATFILGSAAEAEDATQDAAVHAWQHFDSLRDPASFEAWFSRIVVNQCRDRLRARRRQPLSLPVFEGSSPDPTFWSDERSALLAALGRLTPDHRAVVALHYLADLSVADIAVRTASRPGTVRSRLHYALQALRATYEAADRAPGEGSR